MYTIDPKLTINCITYVVGGISPEHLYQVVYASDCLSPFIYIGNLAPHQGDSDFYELTYRDGSTLCHHYLEKGEYKSTIRVAVDDVKAWGLRYVCA